jgi:hypothetical protein
MGNRLGIDCASLYHERAMAITVSTANTVGIAVGLGKFCRPTIRATVENQVPAGN